MLIGINGFKGAGKNVVGEYLCEQYNFKQTSFAALLKKSAAALFDVPEILWETWKNDPEVVVTLSKRGKILLHTGPMSVRTFLQRYGTESHRDVFGYDFWVEQAFKNLDLSENIVFTDARFENELQAILAHEGINLQVLRDETDKESGGHASEVRPHPSLINGKILNNGSFEDLYNTIDFVLACAGYSD